MCFICFISEYSDNFPVFIPAILSPTPHVSPAYVWVFIGVSYSFMQVSSILYGTFPYSYSKKIHKEGKVSCPEAQVCNLSIAQLLPGYRTPGSSGCCTQGFPQCSHLQTSLVCHKVQQHTFLHWLLYYLLLSFKVQELWREESDRIYFVFARMQKIEQ